MRNGCKMIKILLVITMWLFSKPAFTQTVEMVTDIYQFSAISLSDITAFNNKLYFTACAGQNACGLYSSNGTTSATTLVKQSELLSFLTVVGSHLIFFNSNQLWQSDGTESGTTMLKTISKTGDFRMAVLNNKAYFGGEEGNTNPVNDQLWVTDGTTEGTKLLKIINPSGPAYIRDICAVGGKIYFSAYDGGGNGYYMQPWVSDGTAAGTFKLKTVKSSLYNDAMPRNFTALDGKVYFSMFDDASACQLWVTDGTPDGTKKFTDSISGNNGIGLWPSSLIAYNSKLYFSGRDLKNQIHLWSTDGEESNTKIVKANILPANMVLFNDRIFMSAFDSVYKYQIWSSDGTSEGTQRVTSYPGLSPINIYPWNDVLIMLGADTTQKAVELFYSDGTNAGTRCPTAPSTSNDVYTHFQKWVPLNDGLYFRAAFGHFTDYEICRFTKSGSSWIVSEQAQIPSFVFPNPTDGVFSVSLPDSINASKIGIYNQAGTLLKQIEFSNKMYYTDLVGFPAGLYLIQVTDDRNKNYVQKLLKK